MSKPDPSKANLSKEQVIEIAINAVKDKGLFWEGNPTVTLYCSGEDTEQIVEILKSSTGESGRLVGADAILSQVENNENYLWWQAIFNLVLIDAIPIVVDIDDRTGQAFYIREGSIFS